MFIGCGRSPVIAAFHGPGNVRVDGCNSFERTAILSNACMGVSLIDVFMHEIGFKVGVMPKYGS